MRNGLDKELLEEFYIKKRLTLKQIADRLDKGYSTIHYWMSKHGIPRRPSPPRTVTIPKETLSNLYVNKKLNTKQIAKLYRCDDETIREKLITAGISRRSNSDSKTKYPKTPFSNNLVEKAHILGLRTGDFSVRRNHAQLIAETTTSHKLMVELAKSVFGKYGYITEKKLMNQGLKEDYIRIALDNSFEFLLEKINEIPEWILNNDKLFYSFLAGYIDADGCWKLTSNGRKGTTVRCTSETQDKIILKQMTNKLIQLGFTAHFYKKLGRGTILNRGTCNKNVYTFCLVRKREVVKLAEILREYSKHPEKILKIDLIRNCYDKKWDITRPKLDELRSFIKQNLVN